MVLRTALIARLAAFAACLAAATPVLAGPIAARKGLTLDGAKLVAAAASAEARRLGAGGAIAVVDEGGNLLYLERLENTFPAASPVAIEKARTAATFRRPTRDFENAIAKGRTSLVAVDVMTPLQGGVPLVVDGAVVGAIGVSGAAGAQQDDDIAAVRDLIGRHVAATGSTYAAKILEDWIGAQPRFVKVMPKDYQRVLAAEARAKAEGRAPTFAELVGTTSG